LKRLLALILCVALLGSIQIAFQTGNVQIKSVMAASTGKFTGEISSGFINGSYGENLWYVWLNTSGTNVLFLTMYMTSNPSPINYFVGQHYFTQNGTEVFVGNRLLGFEIYEDMNKNGILDADFTHGFNNASVETRYFYMLNASQTAALTAPLKYTVGNITHYTWAVRHIYAQGNIAKIGNTTGSMLDPETNQWVPSYFSSWWSATLNTLRFTFDYWVNNNVTYLKTGLEFGNLTVQQSPLEEPIPENFNNNSLSAVYTTSVLSLKPYQITLQNPQQTGESKIVNSTSINIEKKDAYKMVFGQNYNLSGSTTPYMSTAGVYPITSLPGDMIAEAGYFTQDTENIFKQQLSQTSPALSSNVTLGIRKSSLIYRVCYPTWENRTISNDPLYIAYIGKSGQSGQLPFTKPPAALPQTWLIGTLAFGLIVLSIAVYRHKKIRDYKQASTKDTA
jgi:hypothetical protein